MNPKTSRNTLLIGLGALLLIGAWSSLVPMQACRNVPPRTREAVLKTNLRILRDVIHQHHRDKGSYPATLETLVAEGYLRKIPMDPVTKSSETWVLVHGDGQRGILDVKSGAPGNSLDGQPYKEW